MTTITSYKYICDICGEEFSNKSACSKHEMDHFIYNIDMLKDKLECLKESIICDYCDHSYYFNDFDGYRAVCTHYRCGYNNDYKDFVPTKPLHNKQTMEEFKV